MCTRIVILALYIHVYVLICRRPPLSQKLSELAQHVDFREERADDDNEREEGKKKQEEEEEEGVSSKETKSSLAMGIYILKTQVHKHMYLYTL